MSHSLLCATVAAASLEDLRRQRDAAASVADVVELRLDALVRPDVEAALAGRRGPVIATCRPRWEGGGFDGPEEDRLALLQRAAALGADYVDVEWRARHAELLERRAGRGVVLSLHDFDATPGDLAGRYAAMAAAGAEVVKIAVTARSLGDCLRLGEVGRQAAAAGQRAALVAMGPSGVATRVLPVRFGSCWTYAGDAVAPGQMTPERLVGEFRFRELRPSTRVYGLAGRPVSHSLSPAMHNAAFRACGVDAVYLPLETADEEDFMRFATAMNVAGASVTAPLKVGMLARLAGVDAVSRQVGAVNTLRCAEGRWEGRNTDVAGFLAPLANDDLAGARAAVLGTGGAPAATASMVSARTDPHRGVATWSARE